MDAPAYELINVVRMDHAIDKIRGCTRAIRRAGRGDPHAYNDLIIAADTETSRTRPDHFDDKGQYVPAENIIVAWTLSVRAGGSNVCTVYGSRPSELCIFLAKLQDALPGEKTAIYFHNLSYDYTFIELFLFSVFGFPTHQLNTKPHYPVSVEFENGLILKDSLIIAQKKLEKWADELDVEHKKAVGKWDYERFRDQSGLFSPDELEYIEHDTLALVECLDKLKDKLHKHIYSMPITCTSIIREEVQKAGRRNRARNRFERTAPNYYVYRKLEAAYHGGYTHMNRHAAGWIWPDQDAMQRGWFPTCYDFASSYPFRMLVDRYPSERFTRLPDEKITWKEIIKGMNDRAYLFTFAAKNIRLINDEEPMPVLQLSKCLKCGKAVTDNGRIIESDYVEIVLTEIDLYMIQKQYDWDEYACFDVYSANKTPLPRWFRDLVYKCFADKTALKGGDPVEYALAKARLNSLYGMCCQHCVRDEIIEVYKDSADHDAGEFIIKLFDTPEEEQAYLAMTEKEQNEWLEKKNQERYENYLGKYSSILNYAIGVWVTAYAMLALFELSECLDPEGLWLYSDTDSIYGLGWDIKKIEDYNRRMQKRLEKAGYGAVVKDGREYWPGVAELDGTYKEFKGLHSKCYAVRKQNGDLKITVAGVPKKGAACLKNDLRNFRDGFIFSGEETGKLTHYYMYRPEPFIDENGIEYGNSIDLHACDYEITAPGLSMALKLLMEEEVKIQIYDEE